MRLSWLPACYYQAMDEKSRETWDVSLAALAINRMAISDTAHQTHVPLAGTARDH